MAAHSYQVTSNPKECVASHPTLLKQLATVLPKDTNFRIYHLSTPPTKAEALCSAPPGTRPDRTYCESQFLTASIRAPSNNNESDPLDVLVFAIEVLIYSTAYSTTFFVSKADSTGFLHLLKLPRGSSSPLKEISATFLRHLVETHQRDTIPSVISLFARAQDQYLFPGSVEYSGKHVLDDRGLVRWWCRVLDPLIEDIKGNWIHRGTAEGFLTVPGLDLHETMSYIPKGRRFAWKIGHPLQQISRHPESVPPRCLIPHYPDDPKARYLDELDDEISTGRDSDDGQWKSIKSIEQFWEMMAYRQECSAGRMVGFIWIVFTPVSESYQEEAPQFESQSSTMIADNTWDDGDIPLASSFSIPPDSPSRSFIPSSQTEPFSSPLKKTETPEVHPVSSQQAKTSRKPSTPKKKKLAGPIFPRVPRIKTHNKNYLLERPESTPYYAWRPEGRGQVIADETVYKRVTELLLRLDFANLELASSSSRRWSSEVRAGASGSMGEAWGHTVTGTKVVEPQSTVDTPGVNSLTMGLVRKKRKEPADAPSPPAVNVLSAGMVRKKPKI